MDWELFDIRVGRANRIQFLLIILSFSVTNYMLAFTGNLKLKSAILIPTSYILIVGILRRIRDTNVCQKSLLKILLVVFGILLSFISILVLVFLYTENQYLVFYAGILIAPIFGIPFIITLFFLTIPFFLKGSLMKNKHGYPPEGLRFMSMIAKDYSQAQKRSAEGTKHSHYKPSNNLVNEEKSILDPFEVKGRN